MVIPSAKRKALAFATFAKKTPMAFIVNFVLPEVTDRRQMKQAVKNATVMVMKIRKKESVIQKLEFAFVKVKG